MENINASFYRQFHCKPQYLFSAPGRTELSGNHTDHQHGYVLAAAVNLEMLAWVSENDLAMIRIQSEGYPMCEVSLSRLEKRAEEENTTVALIRGVAAKFAEMGVQLHGFDAYCTSTVLPGSGLSSSAAFEVLLGTIMNHLFNEQKCTAVEIAQIGQWAENVYFGKPCGLMDQTASAVGNIIGIDFANPAAPVVERIDFDFAKSGYALCIIDSGADHADLTDAYAAIPHEMKSVAAFFGQEVLRDVAEEDFYANLSAARRACGDRAILRAVHFFEENKRVQRQITALKNDDFETFLHLVTESGKSSWMLLQNVVPADTKQDIAVALTLAEHLLCGHGAVRIHGGGFAGTIQAFVPGTMLDTFKREMEKVLGTDSCHTLSIRPEGGILVEEYK